MKKNELIKFLQAVKGNPEIGLSSDEEGNTFQAIGNTINYFIETDTTGKQFLIIYPCGNYIDF